MLQAIEYQYVAYTRSAKTFRYVRLCPFWNNATWKKEIECSYDWDFEEWILNSFLESLAFNHMPSTTKDLSFKNVKYLFTFLCVCVLIAQTFQE